MLKMGNQVSTEDEEWNRTYKKIKDAHDLAYQFIEAAISLEEQEKPIEVGFGCNKTNNYWCLVFFVNIAKQTQLTQQSMFPNQFKEIFIK